MYKYPFGEHVLDERASFCPHLLELLGGIDQEVEPGPDVVDGDEVEIPFEERTGCVSDDDQVEVAPLVSVASRGGAEHDRLPCRVKWGARLRFSESRSRMMTVLMTRILPEESPITARSRTDDWAF